MFIPFVNIIIPNEYTLLSVKSKLMGVISTKVGKTNATKSFEESINRKSDKKFSIWRTGVGDLLITKVAI